MKQLCVLLLLLGCAGEDVENNTATVTGDWTITWTIENERIAGLIHLNDDYTGNIKVNNAKPSYVLQGDHDIDIIWEKEENFMKLTRTDNEFELDHIVLSESDTAMSLLLFDEIQILMHRLE